MKRVIIFLFFASSVCAQYARKDGVVQLPSGQAVSGAKIAVCSQPASAIVTPCTPQVALYSTSTGVLPGGGTSQLVGNLAISDANGNYFYYVNPGTYTEQIYGPLIFGSFVRTDQAIGISISSSVNATNLIGPGIISGTFGGNYTTVGSRTDTGNNSHSGIETFTGPLSSNNLTTGNVANKYAAASAYRYVDGSGSDSNDGLSPGTAFATPQKCNTVVVGLGGGTCDARTLYTYTTSTEIDVGQHSPAIPVTLLVPPYGTWTCNVALPVNTNNCLKLFNFSSMIGASAGIGTQFLIIASATANVVDVCGTDPSPIGGSSYIRWEGGVGCQAASGATVSGAVVHVQSLFDISHISDVNGLTNNTNTKALYVHNICCGSRIERVGGSGNNLTGNVPCTFGSGSDSNNGADIGPISCTHSGSGKNAVVIAQSSSGNGGAKYHDIYTEMDLAADTSTTVVAMTGTSGNSDTIDHLVLGADAAGGSSTRYLLDIASGVSVVAHNLQLASGSGNGINDHSPGRVAIQPGASAVITDYSTENGATSLTGYFTRPGMIGLTNNTGFQIFNATITCTTAASAGATCTTAAITMPVAEPDTSYRIVCTGKGPTAVPVVTNTTNSSATQFTITIAALTAVAASFASYDCTVGHN